MGAGYIEGYCKINNVFPLFMLWMLIPLQFTDAILGVNGSNLQQIK